MHQETTHLPHSPASPTCSFDILFLQISMEGSLSGVNGLSARRHVAEEPITVLGLAPIHLQKMMENLAVNRSTLVPLKKPKTATPRTVVRPEFAFII